MSAKLLTLHLRAFDIMFNDLFILVNLSQQFAQISTRLVTGSVLGFKTTASSNLPTPATYFAVPQLPFSSSLVSRKNTSKWFWRLFLWRWTVMAAPILTSVEKTCIRSQTHLFINTVRYRHCVCVCVYISYQL